MKKKRSGLRECPYCNVTIGYDSSHCPRCDAFIYYDDESRPVIRVQGHKSEEVKDVTTALINELSQRKSISNNYSRSQKRQEMSKTQVDFIIITALPEERDAVLAKLPDHQRVAPTEDDIRVYFKSDLPTRFPDGSTNTYNVLVTSLLKMGRVQASSATKDAIQRWHPRYVILVGIAGGISKNDAGLGDVIISNQIIDYELQKLYPGKDSVRYEVHQADPRMLGAALNFTGDDWINAIEAKRPAKGKSKILFGPIATGDKVDARSDFLQKHGDAWPKLIGIEMEAGGVASASFQSASPPGFFMVRGVSDLADGDKDSRKVKAWRSYACDVAASYVIALLQNGPVPASKRLSSARRTERSITQQKKADISLIRFFSVCLDRPAFQDSLFHERSMEDFDKAMEDTITAINTGMLYSRDGRKLGEGKGKSFLINSQWRTIMDDIVTLLREIRTHYANALRVGQIRVIPPGIHQINNGKVAQRIDDKRQMVIKLFNQLCQEAKINPLRY